MILEYRKGFKIHTFKDKVDFKVFIMEYLLNGYLNCITFRGNLDDANYKAKKNMVYDHNLKHCPPKKVNDLWNKLMGEIDYTEYVIVAKKVPKKRYDIKKGEIL